jgi:hypothetical protein
MTPTRRAIDEKSDPSASEPVTTLRNAKGTADGRRVARALVVVGLIGTTALVAVLFAVGARKNSQISELHDQGVPVTVTVSTCRGLLGGSGSNAAGYACRGTFTLAGHREIQAIPGTTLYPPGATVRAVAVPSDPALFTTAALLAQEEPSANVFIPPAILLVLLLGAIAAVVVRTRGSSRPRRTAPKTAPSRA